MKSIFVLGVLFFATIALFGQDKLTNTFSFSNGIYKSFEEFKQNKPSVAWQDVTSDLVVLESVHKAKLGNLLSASDSSTINIGNIWGFAVNGTPYKKVLDEEENGFHAFAGLQLRGQICYYEYSMVTQVPVEVSAYNPLTGKPFRTSILMREKRETFKIMLDFESGNEDIFSLESVKKWIASDKSLLETFNQTALADRKKKLLKFIQIFNDRNEMFIRD
jgi:hypothetical protein